jgi:branched-chain amino acid transport system substrate-binding protein
LLLVQGSDMVNCLKQIVQFGINRQIHVAGTQQELESLAALPPDARIGVWMFEWYWKQSGTPQEQAQQQHVTDFVADVRKRTGGKVPTARTWFGYASVYTFALVAEHEKTIDGFKLARALGDFELPPEVKLQPNKVYYRSGDHQLMTSAFVGEAVAKGAGDPEDLFKVDSIVAGDTTAPAVAATGCTLQWPA